MSRALVAGLLAVGVALACTTDRRTPAFACDSEGLCPEGLACSPEGFCLIASDGGLGGTDAPPGGDGAPDGPVPGGCDTCDDGSCADLCPAGDCDLSCTQGCNCQLDCGMTDGTCTVSCTGGSVCDIDCTGVNNCDNVTCTGQALCLLRCAGAQNCGFDACQGGEKSCPGDIIVCRRDCP
jgi:hypothetical protein